MPLHIHPSDFLVSPQCRSRCRSAFLRSQVLIRSIGLLVIRHHKRMLQIPKSNSASRHTEALTGMYINFSELGGVSSKYGRSMLVYTHNIQSCVESSGSGSALKVKGISPSSLGDPSCRLRQYCVAHRSCGHAVGSQTK